MENGHGSTMIDLPGQLVLRLLLAGAVGAVLGLERELRGHAAGARTQALVAIGAALFTSIGATAFSGAGVDASRMAAQVVSGIGFVGAGVILKNGGSIKGLTTAATLWVSAAVGVAAGAGAVWEAALGGLVALVFVYGLGLARPLTRRRAVHRLHLEYQPGHGTLGPVMRAVREVHGRVAEIQLEDTVEPITGEAERTVTLTLWTRRADQLEGIIRTLERRPEMRRVQLEW